MVNLNLLDLYYDSKIVVNTNFFGVVEHTFLFCADLYHSSLMDASCFSNSSDINSANSDIFLTKFF